ncbi:MAG: hypothetical protein KGL04_04015 [Elusimicrobia bacterium]|nr:hypothetical protein [Elusimicrobiota bacterium]
MICSALVDWLDAADFPLGDASALGRPLAAYPLMAAKSSARVHRSFALSSVQSVKSAALQYGAVILDPPPKQEQSAPSRLLRFAAEAVSHEVAKEGERLELLIVLSAQAPAVTGALIDSGVEAVMEKPGFDSALSASRLPSWTAQADLQEAPDGAFELRTGRDARGEANRNSEIWNPNWSLFVLKPELINSAQPRPLGWLGKKIFAVKQRGIWPVEHPWQIPALESWLKQHGVSDAAYAPEPQPQAQKSVKPMPSRPLL